MPFCFVWTPPVPLMHTAVTKKLENVRNSANGAAELSQAWSCFVLMWVADVPIASKAICSRSFHVMSHPHIQQSASFVQRGGSYATRSIEVKKFFGISFLILKKNLNWFILPPLVTLIFRIIRPNLAVPQGSNKGESTVYAFESACIPDAPSVQWRQAFIYILRDFFRPWKRKAT